MAIDTDTGVTMNLTWITLFGGLCILIYGLNLAHENLEALAGDRLRSILSKITENRVFAFISGFFISLVLQSSSASIAMFVGFASAGLLTLTQAMALILGADLGTTIAVQLIAFHIADYSLLIIIFGFLIHMVMPPKREGYGKFVLGIGFIFLGMWQMSQAAASFKHSEVLPFAISLVRDYTLVSIMFAAIAAAVLQSSAAFLGILLSLAHAGILPLSEALPLVIGANIGHCALPLLVSIKATDRGKQVAIAHISLKIAGALLFIPFLASFENIVMQTAVSTTRQIANAHLLFNVVIGCLFLPFINIGSLLINKIYPIKPRPEPFRAKYLDPHILTSPTFAFGQAQREALRMAGIVQDMVEKIMVAFKKGSPDLLTKIEDLEDRADVLYREIKKFLIKLSHKHITEEQSAQQSEIILLTSDLEHIGDTVEKSILPLIRIKMKKKLTLSKEGLSDLYSYHKKIVDSFQLAMSAYTTRSAELCRKVIRKKEQLLALEFQLREKHLDRLRQGIKESLDTSALHLELLSHLRRINSFISNVSYSILQRED